MTTETGGAAFPTVRDYFAGRALAGLLADSTQTGPGATKKPKRKGKL